MTHSCHPRGKRCHGEAYRSLGAQTQAIGWKREPEAAPGAQVELQRGQCPRVQECRGGSQGLTHRTGANTAVCMVPCTGRGPGDMPQAIRRRAASTHRSPCGLCGCAAAEPGAAAAGVPMSPGGCWVGKKTGLWGWWGAGWGNQGTEGTYTGTRVLFFS